MSVSESQKHGKLISEESEEKCNEIEPHVLDHIRELEESKEDNREKQIDAPSNIRELLVCEKDKQGSEDQNALVIAPWISAPPTASLQVLFNPIAEQQLLAFSPQAEDENYRYGRRRMTAYVKVCLYIC